MSDKQKGMPEGWEFDPYMGEDCGKLRLLSGMTIADEIDRGMAETLAWAIVEPQRAIGREEAKRESVPQFPSEEWEAYAVACEVVEKVSRARTVPASVAVIAAAWPLLAAQARAQKGEE